MPLLPADTLIEKRQLDILRRRLEPYQIVGLEYESDHLVPVLGGFCFGEIPDQVAIYAIFTRIVVVQYSKNIQKRGFA